MAAKNKPTVVVGPTQRRQTSTERSAALKIAIAGEQADLKREAAERRAKRAK